MFQGLYSRISTDVLDLPFEKNRPRVFLHPSATDDENYHEIYNVQLKRGGEYALDLASTQYGHYAPVTLLTEYARSRGFKVVQSTPFDELLQKTRLDGPGTSCTPIEKAYVMFVRGRFKKIGEAIKSYSQQYGIRRKMSLVEALKADEKTRGECLQEYLNKLSPVVKTVYESIQELGQCESGDDILRLLGMLNTGK